MLPAPATHVGARFVRTIPLAFRLKVTMSRRLVLPDLLEPGLDLVICGMAAGTRSAKVGAYYAHGSNKFWRVLAETGLTPRKLAPGDFASLANFGIGLTDLAKHASGSDSDLGKLDLDVDVFRANILSIRPRALAFNGKNAAERALERRSVEYGLQRDRIGETVVFVLPSTSGAASRYWDPRPWHDCAKFLRERRVPGKEPPLKIERINAHLQSRLRKESRKEVPAVEAAIWLDAAGVLPDSRARPGLPLRRLLRDGFITGQEQRPNVRSGRWWIRRCDS